MNAAGLPDPLDLPLADLRRRTSMKWRLHPADVLPLWVAEMDAELAEPVRRAVGDALARSDTGYAWGTGLAEALAGFASTRWRWDGLAVDRTALVPDVMLGVVAALQLVTRAGSAVVVDDPVYPPFHAFVRQSGRRVLQAPLGGDGRLDLAALADAFERARALGPTPAYLLCSPSNPTGTVHTSGELSAVAELAASRGVRVVVDEVHAPLTAPLTAPRPVSGPAPGFTPYLAADHTGLGLTLASASKGWNLAGLKAAVLVAGTAAAGDLARLPEEVGHAVAHLGVLAHTAAFAQGGDWLDALLASLERRRELLAALLAEEVPGLRWTPGAATYLAWLDARPLELPVEPADFFLRHARVALSAGAPFGSSATGFVRLNFATSMEVLTQALTRMGRALP